MRSGPNLRRAAVVVCLLIVSGMAFAAESPFEEFPRALGGFYGPISGAGLHYHQWIGATGFQVSGGVAYNTEFIYSIGAEVQRRLYGDAFTDWLAGSLLVFAGASLGGSWPGGLAVGAGVGSEIIFFRHISIPLELGYGVGWDFTRGFAADAFSVGPRVQAGLRYRY